jgi:hypothetical protein
MIRKFIRQGCHVTNLGFDSVTAVCVKGFFFSEM